MKKIMLFICLIPLLSTAQEVTLGRKPEAYETSDFGIKFSGYVKNDFFGDSHEVTSLREGHFLLFPTNDLIDAQGKIANNEPSFNFLSIQSRITGKFTGHDAFKAKTSGMIEGDFFGNEGDANGFRLRHAVAKLNWNSAELLTGQYWHPLFLTDCSPGVISFNTGAPFQPFSRNPQIRLTEKIDNVKLIVALNSQRDFSNIGGSSELKNASIPDINAQIHIGHKNDSTQNEYLFGGGFEYKIENPRFTSTVNTTNAENTLITSTYKVYERVNSIAIMVFGKYQTNRFSIKAQGIYGQNLTDLLMLGGYAVKEVTNQLTLESTYSPLTNGTGWVDLTYTDKKLEYGIFAGYTKNLGSKDEIIKTTLPAKTRGYDIDNIYRIAPRIVLTEGKFKVAGEIEYTAAAYATLDKTGALNIDANGKVTESEYVNNTRFLASVIYNF